MLPVTVVQLVREIYADESNTEILAKLRDDPEEVLISLLTEIKQNLPEVSAMLRSTVESGAGGVLESVKQRHAERAQKELVKK